MEQATTTRRGFFGHAAGAYLATGAITMGAAVEIYDPNTALNAAAAEIRKALRSMGHDSYMIMINDEERATAITKEYVAVDGSKRVLIELA